MFTRRDAAARTCRDASSSRHGAAVLDYDAELMAAIMDSADPKRPPTEDEILRLILGELPRLRRRAARGTL